MPVITAQQALAIQRGLVIKTYGSHPTTKFDGVKPNILFTAGTDTNYTATLATLTPNVTLTGGATTTGILPGMPVYTVAGSTGAFAAGDDFIYSVNSSTQITIGSDAQYVVRGLRAVLTASTNVVTITNGSTAGMKIGHKVTEFGSGAGAFGSGGLVYVASITGPTTFTVSSDIAGTTPADHATPGAITFDIGGYTKDNATAGAITFEIGGVNLNNEISGVDLSSINRQVFTLATSSSTVSLGGNSVLTYLNGGDINESATLQETERNYHLTGIRLFKKLK